MGNSALPVDIPNKAAFKPSEVCELLGIPAYVLRTWENEFKDLGVTNASASARTYRRTDVELAVRIRELVFAEHLTLAGVRRKLEQEGLIVLPAEEAPDVEAVDAAPALTPPMRARLSQVKQELRLLLQQLANDASRQALAPDLSAPPANGEAAAVAARDQASAARNAARKMTEDAPILPGLGADTAVSLVGNPRRVKPSRDAKLDPAALDFASIASPPPPVSARRRKGKD